jgi:hypothetical protein
VSLDAYTGGEVLVRFEMITDDAVTRPGIAIDDVRIDAIDYREDFETDSGGWEAAGWILTDNRLPQQVWIQVAQEAGETVEVTRWRLPDDPPRTLTLMEGVEEVVIAVSPFAPVTTVPMSYALNVEAD